MKKCNSNCFKFTVLPLSIFLLVICLSVPTIAQRNLHIPDSISKNFHKEVQMREKYWDTVGVSKRRGEYKHFNRWRAFWEMRVNKDGSYPSAEHIHNAFQTGTSDYKRLKADKFQSMPTWEDIGNRKNPTGDITNGGVGRVNAIRQNPSNPEELWAGAAAGGVWRSLNKGQNWEPLYQTEFLSLGVSDIAFAASNSSTAYVATGDFDGSTTNNISYSVGIIKTTDGGETWSSTQTAWTLPENKLISRLWVHPENENIVIATTGSGIIKTTDGGATWTTTTDATNSHRFADLEQMPDNPDVLYASTMVSGATASSSTNVYKSTDMGDSWTLVYTISGGGKRTCLAVTPAAPNSIYALTANEQNGFHSLAISEDEGANWNSVNDYTTKGENYLAWGQYDLKQRRDGQGHYDLALAVSPTNPSTIFIGGVNIWRSVNKGSNFTMVAHWAADLGVPYVHADIHDLIFINNTLYAGHDGGIDYTENLGSRWNQLYEGMGINQIYAINSSSLDPRKIIIGLQDLGSIRRDTNNEWHFVSSGDGMQCYFDPKDDSRYYSSIYNGIVKKFDNTTGKGGTQIIDSTTVTNKFGARDIGAWVTAFAISPQNPNKIYVGYCNIYYHPDYGTDKNKWEKQTNNNYSYSNTIRHIKIYPKDDNIIYAASLNNIMHTNDGGKTWTYMSTPPGSVNITYIAIHPNDPNVLYVTSSGYNENAKLYKWDGSQWLNLSGNLPNVPATCITLQVEGDDTKLYVGTDIGVYYGINETSHYVKWGAGLPNLIITQIETIPSTRRLRAATYGRGIWETSYNESTHDSITIKADGELEFCSNDSVRLYVETPDETDIVWSTGETGSEIWAKEAGTYSATSNSNSESFKISNLITTTTKAANSLFLNLTDTISFCVGDSVELRANGGFENYNWSNGATGRSTVVKEAGDYNVVGLNYSGCNSYSNVVTIKTYTRPEPTTIRYIPFDANNPDNVDKEREDTLIAVADDAIYYQWYLNDKLVSGATSQRLPLKIIKSNEGQWTVAISYESGCFSLRSDSLFFNDIKEDTDIYFEITPKPASNSITLKLDEKYWGNYTVNILDMQGVLVKSIENFDVNSSVSTIDISSLPSGSYAVKIINSNRTFSDVIIKTEK